jgi:hypothetical protein
MLHTAERQRVAIVFGSEPQFDEWAFKYFLLQLNKLQSFYEFVFPELKGYLYAKNFLADSNKADSMFDAFYEGRAKIAIAYEPDYFIIIVGYMTSRNYFFHLRQNVTIATTYKWDAYFSPPSLFEYLLHCICSVLLFMNPKLNFSFDHTDTRGCVLDFTNIKKDDKIDISLGYICDRCRNMILEGTNAQYLQDMTRLVSREWIGNISSFDSVAYNLRRFYNFNIDRDSGFNKTLWEKVKEPSPALPKDIIVALAGGFFGALFAILLANLAK